MSMSNKSRKILVNLFMIEDAAGLDKDKVAKRTEKIISHAECEKTVRICVKSQVQQELKVFGRLPVL